MIFKVLSSWLRAIARVLPGSFDECRLSAGWPPTLRLSQPISAVSPPIIVNYHLHPLSPFNIISQPESRYSFYRPTEGRRLSQHRHCSSPCPRLRIAVAVAISALTAVSHTTAMYTNDRPLWLAAMANVVEIGWTLGDNYLTVISLWASCHLRFLNTEMFFYLQILIMQHHDKPLQKYHGFVIFKTAIDDCLRFLVTPLAIGVSVHDKKTYPRPIFFGKHKFLSCDAMLSTVYAVVVCLCVCICLCVCVCHTPVLYQNG